MTVERDELEARLRLVEDRLAIYNLIATHPLSADTGDATFINSIYTDDVVFDRGTRLHGARGREQMVAFVADPAHHRALEGGLAHFGNLPFVELHGDLAFATSYIALVTPDHQGEPRELSNHGTTTGFRIHRVVANRWTLRRTESGWRIQKRLLLPHDGTSEVRELLREAKESLAVTA